MTAVVYSQREREAMARGVISHYNPTLIIKHRKRNKKQMLYLVFASKHINTESKPQSIDLMGRCFVCKYETRKIGVRHDIS